MHSEIRIVYLCSHITGPPNTHIHTYAQLKHRPRWCFHVCVALRSVRMLETSAPQGFEEGWAGMTGGSNKHDFILVPNDCGIFLRHQTLVVKVGSFLELRVVACLNINTTGFMWFKSPDRRAFPDFPPLVLPTIRFVSVCMCVFVFVQCVLQRRIWWQACWCKETEGSSWECLIGCQ